MRSNGVPSHPKKKKKKKKSRSPLNESGLVIKRFTHGTVSGGV